MGLGNLGGDGLLEPPVELADRVGIDVRFVEGRSAIVLAQVLHAHSRSSRLGGGGGDSRVLFSQFGPQRLIYPLASTHGAPNRSRERHSRASSCRRGWTMTHLLLAMALVAQAAGGG